MSGDTKNASANANYGPLPLVIGVTGHKDLRQSDVAEIQTKLGTIFLELRTRYPSTPLLLMSALAEGGDRLAANMALKLQIPLIAVLPAAADAYQQTFRDEESQKEFANLLMSAQQKYELEPNNPGVSGDQGIDYAAAGAFLARNCQILIALWDGRINNRKGGTAQTVAFKLKGIPEPYFPARSPLDPVESGPVYHIACPRENNLKIPRNAFVIRKLFPESFRGYSKADKAYSRIYSRMDDFNFDFVRNEAKLKNAFTRSKSYLIPSETAATLSDADRTILDSYSKADVLAVHFQRRVLRTYIGMFLLSFFALFFYQIYSYVVPGAPWQVELYFGSLALALILYQFVTKGDYENKYLDYRALAEGLRVQFFWQLAGIKDSVANHYLHKQRSELDWIRNAIRAWSTASDLFLISEKENSTSEAKNKIKLVLQKWIHHQYSYYSKATRRDQRKLGRLKFWRKILLFLAGLLAFIKLIFHSRHHLFVAAMGLAPASGAILYAYIEKRAFSQEMKQYTRMGSLFARAEREVRKLLKQQNYEQAKHVIEQVGKEALAENGDWVILHRERPIQMPKLK
jgi:hypothetical protein